MINMYLFTSYSDVRSMYTFLKTLNVKFNPVPKPVMILILCCLNVLYKNTLT